MAQLISEIEPRFSDLVTLFERNRFKRTKAQIFELWKKMIEPDKPKISLEQFINWTRRYSQKEYDANAMAIAGGADDDLEIIRATQERSIVQIESDLRGVTGALVDEAKGIMENHAEDGMPLKERYFALTIVDRIWGKVLKEKELAIKAHAEKRESVGMFAKLLRGAMSGEFTMKDIERMKEISKNGQPESVATTETIS